MTTTRIVHPVHLVLNAAGLADSATLDAALDAALTRSVGASSSELRRPPGSAVDVHVPPMQWRIPGTLEVSQADQQRVETTVHAAIRRAAPAPAPASKPPPAAVDDEPDFQVVGYAEARAFVPLEEDQVLPTCVRAASRLPGGPPEHGQVGVIYQRTDGVLGRVRSAIRARHWIISRSAHCTAWFSTRRRTTASSSTPTPRSC